MGNRMWAAILRYGIPAERIEVIGKAMRRVQTRDANSMMRPRQSRARRGTREERRVVPAESASGA